MHELRNNKTFKEHPLRIPLPAKPQTDILQRPKKYPQPPKRHFTGNCQNVRNTISAEPLSPTSLTEVSF